MSAKKPSRSIRRDNSPGDENSRRKYSIIRAPGHGATHLIILSDYFEGYWTHYLGGTTKPCTEPFCDGCDAKLPERWYGYIAVLGVKSNHIGVAEITPLCVDICADYRKKYGTLRGASCLLTRTKEKKNGPVTMILKPSITPQGGWPIGPDVNDWVHRLWRIKNVIQHTIEPGVLAEVKKTVNRLGQAAAHPIHTNNGQHNKNGKG